MSDINRTIEELLVDYAGALRDGCIPVFLKSLTREEARTITSSEDFWDGAEVARILNGLAFAEKAATPKKLHRFISHVDAKIASRMKRPRASSRGRRSTHAKPASKAERAEQLI